MRKFIAMAVAMLLVPSIAHASEVTVVGKVLQTQGHTTPACRMMQLRKSADGSVIWFRIPDTGQDNSILAVSMTALTTGLSVNVAYDPSITSGCGTEPQITWISLIGNN